MADPIRSSRRGKLGPLAAVFASGALALIPASASASHEVQFSGPTNFPAGTSPGAMVTGDFNGDLDPDLAVVRAGNQVSVLLGAAGGTFTGPTAFSVGTSPSSIAVGLLDADADPDLVVANFISENVSVLLGATGGTFGAATNFPVAVDGCPTGVVTGNFNPDVGGKLDVATVGDCDSFMTQGQVSILEGDGSGALGAPTGIPVGTDDAAAIAVGEFTGDSDPDLVALNDFPFLLPGDVGLGFGAPTNFGQSQSTLVAIDDFNADGDDDAAIGRGNGIIEAALGTGAGLSSTTTVADPGSGNGLAAGDVNDDGEPDLARGHYSNAVAVLTGVVGVSYGFNGPTLFGAGAGPSAVAIADFNGDTRNDIAVANSGSANVSVLLQTAPSSGPQGPQGPQGPAGPQGPPGKDATVTCKAKGKGKSKPKCIVQLSASASSKRASARLTRDGRTYARGSAFVREGVNRVPLIAQRAIVAGRYVLTVKVSYGKGKTAVTKRRVSLG